MKIVIDNAIPFLEGVLEPYAEIRYLPGREIAARDVRDADALIVRTRTRCDAALLDGSRVRFIATATMHERLSKHYETYTKHNLDYRRYYRQFSY